MKAVCCYGVIDEYILESECVDLIKIKRTKIYVRRYELILDMKIGFIGWWYLHVAMQYIVIMKETCDLLGDMNEWEQNEGIQKTTGLFGDLRIMKMVIFMNRCLEKVLFKYINLYTHGKRIIQKLWVN